MLELIMFLENTFDIKLEPQEMVPDNLDSVIRIVRFVTRKTGSAGTSPA
jgi:acyl carrier protein